jgi:CheY-like chemotaxis protein
VVWNLVINAVKFTPRGGRIDVRVWRKDSHVEITVTDTGSGISPAFLPHIFERFRQENAAANRNHGGLGIGLAIAKNIVEMHGGTITAHSEGENKGAQFVIRLPVTPLRVAPESDRRHQTPSPTLDVDSLSSPTPDRSLDNVRVLVVEDDADSRAVLKRFLVDSGATVSLASNVDDALKTLTSFTPDVLISDVGMPSQDGYDLIRQVREREQTRNLSAIALTAFASTTDQDRAIAAGFQLHMAKPVDSGQLIDAIAGLVGKKTSG